jgi:hypothetical protein
VSTLTTLDDWLELAKGGRSATDWIDCFAPGQHHPGQQPWTDGDVASIVANWRLNRRSRYVPPLGVLPNRLGHGEQLSWLADDSLPSVGEVVDLRRGPRGVLQIRLSAPPRVALAVARGLFHTCSAELYPHPPPGCRGTGPMLKRVALLGFTPPAAKGLDGLAAGRYAEAHPPPRTWVERSGGRTFVFSEGAMAEDDTGATADTGSGGENELELAVIKAKWPDIPDDFLGSLSDDQLNELALAAAPAAAEEPAAEPAAMADPPADRDQLISEIVAAGNGQYTAEQLAQMPDDQLKALWQQLKGGGDDGGTTNMSEKNKSAPAVRPSAAPVRREPAAVNFAERDRRLREYDARMAALERQQRLAMEAAHQGLVHTFCEQLRDAGYLTPALVGTRDKPGPTRKRLLSRSSVAVAKFGEAPGKSDLEEEVDTLKREMTDPRTGKPMFAHLFGEKLGGTLDADDSGAAEAQRAAEAYAERRNKYLAAGRK